MTKYKSLNKVKCCNICGDDCDVWTVDRNAPICKDCKPIPKKKILSESEMVSKILEGEKR